MPSSDQDPSERPAPPTETPSRRAGRWWLPVTTFVAGVVVGVVGLGLVSTAPTASTSAGAGRAGSAQSDPATLPLTATAQVNEACLRVINDAQAVYSVLTGVGELDADVDLLQVDVLVRRLQPLQPRLEQDLPACEVSASAPPATTGPVPPPGTEPPPGPVPPPGTEPAPATPEPTTGPTR